MMFSFEMLITPRAGRGMQQTCPQQIFTTAFLSISHAQTLKLQVCSYDLTGTFLSCCDEKLLQFVVEWPGNQGKCTHLFDYCITYIEDDDSDKGSFVSEVTSNLNGSLYCRFIFRSQYLLSPYHLLRQHH